MFHEQNVSLSYSMPAVQRVTNGYNAKKYWHGTSKRAEVFDMVAKYEISKLGETIEYNHEDQQEADYISGTVRQGYPNLRHRPSKVAVPEELYMQCTRRTRTETVACFAWI